MGGAVGGAWREVDQNQGKRTMDKITFPLLAVTPKKTADKIRDPAGLFKEPVGEPAPDVPDPIAAPTIDSASAKAESDADRLRRRRGRAATILTDDSTNTTQSTSGARLLGS